MTGPDTAPMPLMAPNSPYTLPLSSGRNVTWMIDSTCGTIMAAMTPCRMRAPISISGPIARPERADATVKPSMES